MGSRSYAKSTFLEATLLLLGATSCLNLALQWGDIIYPWSKECRGVRLPGWIQVTLDHLFHTRKSRCEKKKKRLVVYNASHFT